MARGGSRQGAGRKPGGTNRFSKELLAKATTDGRVTLYSIGRLKMGGLQENLVAGSVAPARSGMDG